MYLQIARRVAQDVGKYIADHCGDTRAGCWECYIYVNKSVMNAPLKTTDFEVTTECREQ